MTVDQPLRTLHRRMAPAALLVGVLLGVLPPLGGWGLERARASAYASTVAERVAAAVRRVALRQPVLWRYDVHKLLDAIAAGGGVDAETHIEISGCDDQVIFSGFTGGLDATGPAQHARAEVRTSSGVIAYVHARSSLAGARRAAVRLGAVSVPIGVLVAVFLVAFPTRVVREQLHARALVRRTGVSAVAAQERERARIARELHDSLGQHLTALRIALAPAHVEEEQARLDRLRALNAAMLEDLRRVIGDLRPVELDGRAFREALADYAELYERRTGVAVSIAGDAPALPPEHATALIRVLQEALTNVARHAGASEVGVRVRAGGGLVTLEIEDDGSGFEVERAPRGDGIRNMRERVELLDGTLEIAAARPGTRVTARIPWSP